MKKTSKRAKANAKQGPVNCHDIKTNSEIAQMSTQERREHAMRVLGLK